MVEAAAAFFDDLGLHKGPPLGCSMALAQPYVQTMYQKERQRVGGQGLGVARKHYKGGEGVGRLGGKGSDVGDFLDADTAHRMSKFWTNLAWEGPVRKTLPKSQSSDGV